ncbi:hypothetical protein [Desulfurella multipotens]|jgi:DNA polymerase-3 subunit delta'|uniref:DNA polymerase-3 subunit delta n=1 Tax=Desulfurella multipotens TaxID=79269 RepID=A0A1G6LE57_9BACT|nr:hypothetical protein [Desulfurella multipotens]PMP66878.1 MAG: hypothetical protein C0192_04010 [Desulfurella multipotens]SDC41237.1 DNA polymerase-3 subunit delta' [Desulfurella multipotens]
MKQYLSKFTTFALINATLDDARDFCQSLNVPTWYEFEDLKLQDVNQIKIKSYEISEKPYAFLIGKANIESQNALLKLTEEPINLNYFIFYQTEYIIDTLISRSQIINFNIEDQNIDKLFEFFEKKDKSNFLKELLNIKNLSKQNKPLFLKYIKSFIKRLSYDFPENSIFLIRQYKDLRTYNLNIDLFLANMCIELWRIKK